MFEYNPIINEIYSEINHDKFVINEWDGKIKQGKKSSLDFQFTRDFLNDGNKVPIMIHLKIRQQPGFQG